MDIGDLVEWVLVGALTGVLASALLPGRSPRHFVGVVAIGVLGAVAGGSAWALLFGSSPTTFLGSVILGLLGVLTIPYLLRQADGTQCHL